jgi:outer membrane protein OmpA-like peptidoglycan-associated protein
VGKFALFLLMFFAVTVFANDYPVSEPEPEVNHESVVEQPEPGADYELVVEQPEPDTDYELVIEQPESGADREPIVNQPEPAIALTFTTETVRSLLLSVIFEADSTALTPASSAELDSITALSMLDNPLHRYEIHGHSCVDAEGRNLTMRYSIQRVEAMMNFLLTNGVSARNIVTIVHGAGQFDETDDLSIGEVCVHNRRGAIMLKETRHIEVEPEPEQEPEPEPEPVAIPEPTPDPTPAPLSMDEFRPRPDPAPTPTQVAPSLESLALEQGKMAVAIYMAGEEPTEARGVHNILGGELARILSESDSYLAVDRTEAILEQLAREHIYQRSGAVDDDQIKALGQQLGVQYLCISNISAVGRGFYLDTRLVDVVTAEIVRSVTATSRLNNANEMTRIARNIALELLEAERTREQRARRKKIFRYTAIGLDILGAGALVYGYYENNNVVNQVNDKESGDGDEAGRAATRRNAAYIAGGALLATGVSFHILF